MGARDYLTLLREQKWLIATFVVLGLVAAVVVTLATPRSYSSSASFYVVANGVSDSTSTEQYQGAQLSTDRIKSYAELLAGPRVAEDASRLLEGRVPAQEITESVTTDSVAETVLITMTVTSDDPDGTWMITDAVTRAFTGLVTEIETPRTPQAQGVPILVTQLVQPPSDPTLVGPRPAVNVLIGLTIGLLLGLGMATARHSFRGSLTSPGELEDTTGTTVLATVPEDATTRRAPIALVDAPGKRATAQRSESYQRLRAHVEFANLDGDRRVLVVTSALHDEGKTTTAANLAAALAGTGNRVVVVEADLRRPSLLRSLGLTGGVGLTGVVTGSTPLDEALQSWEGRFDVLGAGEAPPRPNELLASARVGALVEELRRRYDFVLLDAPPVLPVADAAALGRRADGVILVCRAGRTSRDDVSAAVSFLRSVSVPVVGTVLSHGVNLPVLKQARREKADAVAPTPATPTPAAPTPAASAPAASAPVGPAPTPPRPAPGVGDAVASPGARPGAAPVAAAPSSPAEQDTSRAPGAIDTSTEAAPERRPLITVRPAGPRPRPSRPDGSTGGTSRTFVDLSSPTASHAEGSNSSNGASGDPGR